MNINSHADACLAVLPGHSAWAMLLRLYAAKVQAEQRWEQFCLTLQPRSQPAQTDLAIRNHTKRWAGPALPAPAAARRSAPRLPPDLSLLPVLAAGRPRDTGLTEAPPHPTLSARGEQRTPLRFTFCPLAARLSLASSRQSPGHPSAVQTQLTAGRAAQAPREQQRTGARSSHSQGDRRPPTLPVPLSTGRCETRSRRLSNKLCPRAFGSVLVLAKRSASTASETAEPPRPRAQRARHARVPSGVHVTLSTGSAAARGVLSLFLSPPPSLQPAPLAAEPPMGARADPGPARRELPRCFTQSRCPSRNGAPRPALT